MDKYHVLVKKNGKWKKNSTHQNRSYAEINAKVQHQAGFEAKVIYNNNTVLHLKKEV